MLTLRKYFGTIRNALYEEQLANDLGSIETAVNGIERDVTNHKRTEGHHLFRFDFHYYSCIWNFSEMHKVISLVYIQHILIAF